MKIEKILILFLGFLSQLSLGAARADAGSSLPKILEVFHDGDACQAPSSLEDVKSAAIEAIEREGHSSLLGENPVLNYRLVLGQRRLDSDQIKDFNDFGADILISDRKQGDSERKTRDRLRFFLDHYADSKSCCILLIVEDARRFFSEIEALMRKGIPVFVISTSQDLLPSHFHFLGLWATLVDIEDPVFKELRATSGSSFMRSAARGGAVEGGAVVRSVPQYLTDGLLASPFRFAGQGRNNRRGLGAIGPAHALVLPSSSSSSSSSSSWRSFSGTGGMRSHGPAQVLLGGGARGSKGAHQDPGSATSSEKDFSIVTGELKLVGGRWFFKEDSSPEDREIGENLDFSYEWIERYSHYLETEDLSEEDRSLRVCCRLYPDKKLSDFRIVGRVYKILKKSYGFIDHKLYPAKVYFKLKDLDDLRGGRIQNPQNGDSVAFRVAQKDNRIWALRVYKIWEKK